VLAIGNGSFLSNASLGLGGNLDLGINIFNWLAGDDTLIAIQPRPALDNHLDLGPGAQYLLLFGFLIFAPLAFISTGIVVWWRRRRP